MYRYLFSFLWVKNTCNISSVLINNSLKMLTVTDPCSALGVFMVDVCECILDFLESVEFSVKFMSLGITDVRQVCQHH